MTLYQYLQYEGIQRELSLRQIAIQSGLSVQAIYLLKKRRPNYTTYNKLAQFLDIDVAELYKYPITNDWHKEKDLCGNTDLI